MRPENIVMNGSILFCGLGHITKRKKREKDIIKCSQSDVVYLAQSFEFKELTSGLFQAGSTRSLSGSKQGWLPLVLEEMSFQLSAQ